RMLVVLGEMIESPADSATIALGGSRIEFHALGRPNGPIGVARNWASSTKSGSADRSAPAESHGAHPSSDQATSEDGGPVSGPPGLLHLWADPEGEPDGETPEQADVGLWEQGVNAARAGAHSEALGYFEKEAADALDGESPARAAIALRSASAEAELLGRSDTANRLLRTAGKRYLDVAETAHTPLRGIRQAYEMAAKCFLQAGNLKMAETAIVRARSLDDALG
ncbi:MAG: hypothetical protein ACRD0I_05000, partial [Acidimicrobiales bacterium]